MCAVSADGLLSEIAAHEPIAKHLWQKGFAKTAFEAYRLAVQRTQARPSNRELFPIENLAKVLPRLGAFDGCTTSGIEQNLSKLDTLLTSRNLEGRHKFLEFKILCDGGRFDMDEVCSQARIEWSSRWGAPRASAALPRIHSGLPGSKRLASEAEFIRKRRRTTEEAPHVSASENLWYI